MFSNKVKLGLLIVTVLMFTANLFSEDKKNIIVAEWKDHQLTKKEFLNKLAEIPVAYRKHYQTIENQKKFLENLVYQKLFLEEAKNAGLDTNPEFLTKLEEVAKPQISEEYRTEITGEINPVTESEISDYYTKHSAAYVVKPNIKIRYIAVDTKEDADSVALAFENNVDFIDILNKYSTHKPSKSAAGLITNIRDHDYINKIGNDPVLGEAIFSAPVDEMMGPIYSNNKYHFFRKLEHIKESIRPYEEVKNSIKTRLEYQHKNEAKDNLFLDFIKKYEVVTDTTLLFSVNLDDRKEVEANSEKIVVNTRNADINFTLNDCVSFFKNIPPEQRDKLKDHEYLKKLVNQMIFYELLYKEAIDNGFDKKFWESKNGEQIFERQLIQYAYNKFVKEKVSVHKKDIKEFYKAHIEDYKIAPYKNIQLFTFATEENAKKQLANIQEILNGKKFFFLKKYSKKERENKIKEIIDKESTLSDNNTLYKKNGIIENIKKNGLIRGIGKDDQMLKIIWETPVDSLSTIFKTKDDEFAFLRVLKYTDDEVKPLEKVENSIKSRLLREKSKQLFDSLVEEFKTKYNVVFYYDNLEEILSAKELFELAEKSKARRKFQEAAKFYDIIVDKYKNGKDDANALFMKAFMYSDEAFDKENAIKAYQDFIKKFPNHDLADSAQAMLDDLLGKKPLDEIINN